MMDVGPIFEDAVGAQLLTAVLTMPSIVKERHDKLDFENHVYIRHDVRLVVAVDRLPLSPDTQEGRIAPYPAWGTSVLQAGQGRVVVPLGDLDRHSRATTHITDEQGDLVPLFTSGELNTMLGSGLVCFAAMVIPNLAPELIQHLRKIPLEADVGLDPAGTDPQVAADQAFERACVNLLANHGSEGLKLLRDFEFRLALAAITSAVQLVVAVDPKQGQTRVFSYSYVRPITALTTADIAQGQPLLKRWRLVRRYWSRSGSTNLKIDLGPVGGCERYQLTASAPFDTWFAKAHMDRANATSELIDTSQKFRISYTHMSSQNAWSAVLRVKLMTVYTGVTRASVYASKFLAVCAIAGTIRVVLAPGHTLIADNTDAAASLLLLFPGIAASAVAGAARNTLTATLQFPMRITLWSMSLASFVLATAAAFRLGGVADIVLWGLVSAFMCLAAFGLHLRARQWDSNG
jgi:hypothetical protein